MYRMLAPTALLLFAALPGWCHEFWIEPVQYQVETDQTLIADLLVGQNFVGTPQVYFETRVARFDLLQNAEVRQYRGRSGDVPALQTVASDNGLLIAVHQTRGSTLKYGAFVPA